jgi:3-dehydroquinate synthase
MSSRECGETALGVIEVPLGARGYQIRVVSDGLRGLGRAVATRFEPGRAVLVTNPVVGALYAEEALDALSGAGFSVARVDVPDGEAQKTLSTWTDLMNALLDAGLDRGTPVVALGGGVTGDVAGFAAATVLRGVPIVQVPTTLLAMVDSAVGGKTAVNTRHGKNLVGAFHQPTLVYVATGLLGTLPDAEWRSGLGESLKYGAICDSELFDWMVDHSSRLVSREPAAVAALVHRCCTIKAQVVAADEFEAGPRAILNFGHTLGHAIEAALGFGTLRHGEAVAMGMLGEARFARKKRWTLARARVPERIGEALGRLGLPLRFPWPSGLGREVLAERLLQASYLDKKSSRGRMTLVVPAEVGQARLETHPVRLLSELIDCFLADSEVP